MEEHKLIVPQLVFEKMIDHGQESLPNESCGLLAGITNQVRSIWELENELKSDRRFFVRKKVVEETLQQVTKQKEQVLAIYHSHPSTAPVPSQYDLLHHADDTVKMVIVSFKSRNPKVKCYDVVNMNYKECPILIEPTS